VVPKGEPAGQGSLLTGRLSQLKLSSGFFSLMPAVVGHSPSSAPGTGGQAISRLSGTSAELLRCNLFIDLGFARHHAGNAAEARTALREGADHATRLGASRLAGVAGRGLLACGARPRRLHTSGRESLTPAELRVVRLAAEGQSNGAIADALFINAKTVESHLTRAYRKLGITDRAELADALGSHGDSGFGIPKVS
jgi:DNA-binding CsgD family transcriptional regulator